MSTTFPVRAARRRTAMRRDAAPLFAIPPRLLLAASLAAVIAGQIPVVETPGLVQPAMRALFELIGGVFLVMAASRLRSSVVQPLFELPVAVAAVMVWCVLSVGWSVDKSASALRATESLALVLFLQSYLYMLGRASRSMGECASVIALGFASAGAFGLVLNVLLFGTPLHMWVNPEVMERERFTLGFLHPLATGDIFAIAVIAVVCSSWSLAPKATVALACFLFVHLSDSTGARVAVALVVGWVVVFSPRSGWSSLFRILAAVAVLCLALFVELATGGTHIDRLLSDERIWKLTGRVQIWDAILQNGLATTPLGAGFDAARVLIEPLVGKAYHAHNLYLNVMIELGLIGFALFVVMLGFWAWRLARYGSVLPTVLFIYIVGLGLNNPGVLSKAPLMFAFLASLTLPLFFPGSEPAAGPRSASLRTAPA